MNKAKTDRVKEITKKLREMLDRDEEYSNNREKMASKIGAMTYWIEQLESEMLQ